MKKDSEMSIEDSIGGTLDNTFSGKFIKVPTKDYDVLTISRPSSISQPNLLSSADEMDADLLAEMSKSIERIPLPVKFKDKQNLKQRFAEYLFKDLSNDPTYVWVKKQVKLLKGGMTKYSQVIGQFYGSFMPKFYANWLRDIEGSLISNDMLFFRTNLDKDITSLRSLSYFLDKLYVTLMAAETRSFYPKILRHLNNQRILDEHLEKRKQLITSLYELAYLKFQSGADLWTYLLLSNSENLEGIKRIKFLSQPQNDSDLEKLVDRLKESVSSFRCALYSCIANSTECFTHIKSLPFEYPIVETDRTGLSAWNSIVGSILYEQ